MPLDYSALLYDPVYAEIGVPAQITAGVAEAEITIIDYTRAKVIPMPVGSAAGVAEVRSVGPSAVALVYELTAKGIARDDYSDAVIAFNGRTWIVRSWELLGSPNGEDLGQVRFMLRADA